MLLRFLVMPSWRYLNNIIICFDNIPMCFSAHGQWSSGSEGQLSDSPSEWSVLITSCPALKRHEGVGTISCTCWCDTNKHDQMQTKLLFSLLFIFLYLLIILNTDENTTFFFIGFRGGDFIDSVYVFDRLLVQ